jgi:hypothetical protein
VLDLHEIHRALVPSDVAPLHKTGCRTSSSVDLQRRRPSRLPLPMYVSNDAWNLSQPKTSPAASRLMHVSWKY